MKGKKDENKNITKIDNNTETNILEKELFIQKMEIVIARNLHNDATIQKKNLNSFTL